MNLNKPTKQLAVDLINQCNKTNFNHWDIEFLYPLYFTGGNHRRNTKATIAGINNWGGKQVIYYDRIDVDDISAKQLFNEVLPDGNYKSSHCLIPLINQKLKIQLTKQDVIEERIAIVRPGRREIFIQLSSKCLAFYGDFHIKLESMQIDLSKYNQKINGYIEDEIQNLEYSL